MRDASYIAANLRPEDAREIVCLWKDWDTRKLGYCAVETAVADMAWSAWYGGQPAVAFGFSHASAFDPDHWQAWAFGTGRFKRCVPTMTRYLQSVRSRIEKDCRRLQAITHTEHVSAHRWIEGFGGRQEGLLRCYGRNGEDFAIYAWTASHFGNAVE